MEEWEAKGEATQRVDKHLRAATILELVDNGRKESFKGPEAITV